MHGRSRDLAGVDPLSLEWLYLDSVSQEFGPFPAQRMREWFLQGFFPRGEELLVRLPEWKEHMPLRVLFPDSKQAFGVPMVLPRGSEPPPHESRYSWGHDGGRDSSGRDAQSRHRSRSRSG